MTKDEIWYSCYTNGSSGKDCDICSKKTIRFVEIKSKLYSEHGKIYCICENCWKYGDNDD